MIAFQQPRSGLCGLITGVAFTRMAAVLVSTPGDAFLSPVADWVASVGGAAGTGDPRRGEAVLAGASGT